MQTNRVVITVGPSESDVGRLFSEEGDKIWRSLLLHTADREIASDATSEAFAQLIGRGEVIRDPRAWVWRAAFRIADGELGIRNRRIPATMPSSYEVSEPVIDLVHALRKLSTSQRRAVVLHHLADWSVADIAHTLGTSRSVVAVHLYRGRKRLREILEENDD